MLLVGVVFGCCFVGNVVLLGCCDVIIVICDVIIGMVGLVMIEGGGLGCFVVEEVGLMGV